MNNSLKLNESSRGERSWSLINHCCEQLFINLCDARAHKFPNKFEAWLINPLIVLSFLVVALRTALHVVVASAEGWSRSLRLNFSGLFRAVFLIINIQSLRCQGRSEYKHWQLQPSLFIERISGIYYFWVVLTTKTNFSNRCALAFHMRIAIDSCAAVSSLRANEPSKA